MGGFKNVLLSLCLFAPSVFTHSAHAMNASPTLVQVSCACKDPGGIAYLQAVHELLATSSQFKEIGPGQSTGETIQLKIVSAPHVAQGQLRTGLSILCTHNGTPVLSEDIETCNQYPVANFVKTLLSELGSL
jgi:hypothetical protein